MEMIMRKLLGLAMVAGALMVSACNTVEGVGKDVKSAGSAVEDAAD
jgi:predicted small secreted protein